MERRFLRDRSLDLATRVRCLRTTSLPHTGVLHVARDLEKTLPDNLYIINEFRWIFAFKNARVAFDENMTYGRCKFCQWKR